MKKIAVGFLLLFMAGSHAWAHVGHEHVSDAPLNVQWGLEGLKELISIHPVFVHFPIALLVTSVAFYFLGLLFRKGEFFFAGKWVLYFGTASAGIAVWTGLQAAKTVTHTGETHPTMMAHQYLGFIILGLSLILSLWVVLTKMNIPSRGRIFFLVAVVVLGLLIIQQADLGGRLVFSNRVGVGKKSALEKIRSSQHHDSGHTVAAKRESR